MKRVKYISILTLVALIMNLCMPIVQATSEEITENLIEEENKAEASDEETKTEDVEIPKEEQEEQEETKEVEKIEELETDQTEETMQPEEMEKEEVVEEVEEEIQPAEMMIETQEIQEQALTAQSSQIEDGIYTIRTGIASNMVLDIDAGSKKDGANVQIWQDTDVEQQKFEITNLNNGYYKITVLHSQKVLDVDEAKKVNGTNVKQYMNTGSDAQQWMIQEVENGYYNFISKCNGLYLDVYGGYRSNGTNVQMYEGNGSNAQKFKLDKEKELVGEQTIPDGVYNIKTGINSNMLLDIDAGSKNNGANLQIWQNTGVDQQKFEVTYLNNGCYRITAVHSQKALDVYNGNKVNGTNVWQYASNDSEAQQWIIQEAGGGYYNIISKCNGLYLDVYGGYSANGTNVQMYKGNGSNAQKFKFVKKEKLVGEQTISNGIYKITTGIAPNMVLDIDAGSKNDRANLQIWQSTGVYQQRFEITYLNNGYYRIMPIHSQKALDVANRGQLDGTNVYQYISTGSDAQQWIIKETEDGYYNIISKCNGLYLDVYGGYTSNGTNVQMYEGNGSKAQKFKFDKAEDLIGTQTIPNGKYRIVSNINSNFVLDVSEGSTKDGANVQIYTRSNVKQQVFSVNYNGDGTYTIEMPYANKVLDVHNAGKTNGTNVKQATRNGSDAQRWIIKEAENGTYHILSKCNGLYLDVFGNQASNGANIQMYEKNGSNAQQFVFEEFKESENPIVYDGTYRITTAMVSNKALDVDGGSKEARANVQIWSSTNVLQQKFRLKHIGNNYYIIEIAHSGMVLEVANNGMGNGTNVWQNVRNGSDAQQWKIVEAGNGYYNIISKLNGLCLDVYGGYTTNGTNVQVYTGNGSNAQKFKLDEIYFGIDVSYAQDEIDYDQLVSSGQVEFMIARTGWYSERNKCLNIDEQFERNYRLAKEKGIPLGTYLYSYASSIAEATNEANALARYLTETGRSFELPVFIDIEDPKYQAGLSKQLKTDICRTFGEILKNAGYRVGIYTFKNWIISEIDMNQIPSDYSVWVASWGINDGYVPTDINKYVGNHDIWQYTSSGTVSGISGNVDINIAYKRMF